MNGTVNGTVIPTVSGTADRTSVVGDAITWLNDPFNWTGQSGVPSRLVEHLGMSALAVLLAAAVALPVGIYLGHVRRGGGLAVVLANASRALPTLALLLIFASTAIGFGNRATVLAAAVFAIPPILTNAYTGVLGVDPDVRDAAHAMGMTPMRSLLRMELPLAVPLVAAGLRTATVQVIATVPLAALVGGGGLGPIIVSGFANRRFGQVLAGAVLVAGLCLVAEAVLAVAQRAVTPVGLRAPRRGRAGAAAPAPGA
ncbi:ABC transporter permease [uncultured Cellulomonas sp.]|uniref:ABC transporter permease n=1 Tax=uncultured Cellulomonas sp. TaxID=189682 RepID=UPI00262C2240|nr:ABC transporter permease subunit [uncultured Cellulomonas sp.]